MKKICQQITVAAFMQPLRYDLRSPAAKDNSITNAATARRNLDATIYREGTILDLQITMEFHRQLIHQHHLQSHLQWGNDPRVANHNGIPSETHPPAPLAIYMRERSYSCKSQWNSVDRTCETPFTMRNRSETDPNDPTVASMIGHNGIHVSTAFRARLHPSARREGTILELQIIGNSSTSTTCKFTMRERSYSCKSQWNSVDHTCTKHRNPIYNAEPIRPIRPWSDHDPSMIRPHTRPSRTRRTAEVDHRRSGTDFVWKNIGFRASAISQKRISCETSSKTPSATPPPAPLAIPFTVRERS